MFHIINHYGNANKNQMRYDFIPIRMAIIKKMKITSIDENVGKLKSLRTVWWECKMVQLLWKRYGDSSKSKHRGFPGGAVVENLPANAGDTGSSPGLGRSHMPRSN